MERLEMASSSFSSQQVRVFDDSIMDQELYENYIQKHPESMFFHSYSYIKFLQEILNIIPYHLLAFDNGILVGVLPLLLKNGPLGKVYNSLPYYGSNGGVLADNIEIAKELIFAYNQVISEDDVLGSVWVENLQSQNDYKELVKYNLEDFRIGQLTSIAYSENHGDNLMESFHYKTRNMVRKGIKSEFDISVNNATVEFLREVHVENMSAIGGKAKSSDFFKFPDYFIADQDYKIWVASYQGEPVAALLLFYFKDIVEYYTPVIRESFRDKQPLSHLIFSAMTDASERGYKLWNWGGTWATQTGVYTFKKRWGTFDKEYKYLIQMNKEDVFSQTAGYLLENYSDFFVVPFNLLKSNINET
jgi:hypothetical protein